jgi:hypothetical protein
MSKTSDAGSGVDGEGVGDRIGDLVVSPARGGGERCPAMLRSGDPAVEGGRAVAVDPADVGDDLGPGAAPRASRKAAWYAKSAKRSGRSARRRVEDDVLGGVHREAEVERPRLRAECRSSAAHSSIWWWNWGISGWVT